MSVWVVHVGEVSSTDQCISAAAQTEHVIVGLSSDWIDCLHRGCRVTFVPNYGCRSVDISWGIDDVRRNSKWIVVIRRVLKRRHCNCRGARKQLCFLKAYPIRAHVARSCWVIGERMSQRNIRRSTSVTRPSPVRDRDSWSSIFQKVVLWWSCSVPCDCAR